MMKSLLRSRPIAFALAILLLAVAHLAHAQQDPPAGSKGWWYYINASSDGGYAPDPVSACKITAANHMGTPLLAVRPAGIAER